MKIYRIKLLCTSGTLTPFQADTLFGHLCWVVAHNQGEDALRKFLEPFKDNEPPFILSDGFPEDLLPRPLIADIVAKPEDKKEIKKREFVTIEEFNRIRKGDSFLPKETEIKIEKFTIPHNSISRLSGTTLAEGGLYSLEETFIPYVSIYLKVISDAWKDKVIELFKELSYSGYGRKKSIGKGQFQVESVDEFNHFENIKNANGFVTLSNFCPQANDPAEGIYKTFVKYGKLGEEYTFLGNPFKQPLIMIKTGSVFKTNGAPKEHYGRMVNGISPIKPEVVQYAYAFALTIVIKTG